MKVPALIQRIEPVPFDALSYLCANAATRGSELALYDQGTTLDFDSLLGAALAFIDDLRVRGLGSGDVVAVALPNVWHFVALEIAIPAAGGVVLPLPMTLGRREIASSLERSGAKMIITDDSDRGNAIADGARFIPSIQTVLAADELQTASGAALEDVIVEGPDPDRVVQIALTSGTTGPPKLASLTARLKQLTFEGFTTRLGLGPGDRMLPLSPVTQGAGEMCLYALRTGAALVMSHDPRFDPERSLALTEQSRATVLGGVPTIISRMLHSAALEGADLSAVRTTISAGAPLPRTLAQAWEERSGSRVCSFYGAMDIGQLAVPSPNDPAEKRWTTVGRPHDCAELLICDPDGRPLPATQEGEICMRGPLVHERYWGELEGPCASDGWAHFGDLGYVDEEGYLHVTGRLKDTIIRGGTNINPVEVEDLLRALPSVRDACLVGRPDIDLGERAVAFIVAAPGSVPTHHHLLTHLEREGLARYKWPEDMRLVDALPIGSTGKLDRQALQAQLHGEG